jgi:hypothetical protein
MEHRFVRLGPWMTLAAVVLLTYLPWSAYAADLTHQSATAAPPAAQNQETAPQQNAPANAQQSPPTTTPAKPSTTRPQTAKKPVHKKKATPSNCDAAAPGPAGPSQSGAASTTSGTTNGSTSAQNSANSSPSKNCPPTKIVVSHGGATEPSIQLAGGAGGSGASQERDATAQMLEVTQSNLKKLSAQQLSTSQQESVTQIRQFVEQSKAALASGDTERARTLAWKAQVLSEDLVKPQQ